MLVGEDEHRRKRKSLLKEVFVEVLRHVKNPSLKVNIEIHSNVFFLWPGSWRYQLKFIDVVAQDVEVDVEEGVDASLVPAGMWASAWQNHLISLAIGQSLEKA